MKKTIAFILAAYAMLASAVKIVAAPTLSNGIKPAIAMVLCIIIIIWHMVDALSYQKKEVPVIELYHKDFLSKLYLIPFYILFFAWGFGFVVAPLGFLFLPFLFLLGYMVLLSSSAYGLSALIREKRTDSISPKLQKLYLIMHFLFFFDFFGSYLLWKRINET
ncbi:MAG: hypothetical protein UHS41_08440 [Lachnospiraceae bacterium]|nr:hypothetical protein [Lachnospiraceae bacterium]